MTHRNCKYKKKRHGAPLIQKIGGLFIAFASLLPMVLDGDGTAAMLMVPAGLYLALTKETWIYGYRK